MSTSPRLAFFLSLMFAIPGYPGALLAQVDPDEEIQVVSPADPDEEVSIRSGDPDEVVHLGDGDPDEGIIMTSAPSRPTAPASPVREKPRARFGGSIRDRLTLDIAHEGHGEDVFDNRFKASIYTDVSFPSGTRIYLEARLSHFTVGESSPEGETWYLLNSENVSTGHRMELREAYVYFPNSILNLRVGNQIVRWGAGQFNRPTDVLNPGDMEEGMMNDLEVPLLPVPMVLVDRAVGPFTFSGVWIPFFYPNRFNMSGQDFSAMAVFASHPELAGAVTVNQMGQMLGTMLSSTMETRIQPLVQSSDPPEDDLLGSQFGLRAQTRLLDVDLGLMWFYGWDKFPTTEVNPVMLSTVSTLMSLDPTSPDYSSRLMSLMPALQELMYDEDGGRRELTLNSLFRTRQERQHVLGFDAATIVLDTFGLTVNAAWSPERTLFFQTCDGLPRADRKGVFSYAVGLDYHRGSWFTAMAEWYQFHVIDVARDEALFIINDSVSMITWALIFRALEFEALELQLAGMYEVSMANWFLFPKLSYSFTDSFAGALGAALQGVMPGGYEMGPAGLFQQNNGVYVEARIGL